MPLRLTDEQLTAIMRGAAPLAPNRRDAYLREIADALAGRELGDGTLFRIIRETQRKHFDAPQLGDPGMISKYR
jgi:hypothetical protein